MGGETAVLDSTTHIATGPSPRGRGNPAMRRRKPSRRRSIPAWAGKPCVGARACALLTGPSPRGRGNPGSETTTLAVCRSIPAWAGKPQVRDASTSHVEVHPRVGGETPLCPKSCNSRRGPSPRGRGNLMCDKITAVRGRSIPAWAGKPGPRPRSRERPTVPSPRGRGNPSGQCVAHLADRSIPAWAGKPQQGAQPPLHGGVHPRVGGETPLPSPSITSPGGPSPRGRGNPITCVTRYKRLGSIPAWAGKPRSGHTARCENGVHPRVGGETEQIATGGLVGQGPSPRGRGNRSAALALDGQQRSIPAWAGKPFQRSRLGQPSRVHPRVGGETAVRARNADGGEGPSPRGRGNHGLTGSGSTAAV